MARCAYQRRCRYHPRCGVGRSMSLESSDDLVQERRRIHYELEVQLADRLRTAPASDRPRVYGEVYDELFSKILDHSQLAVDPARRALVAKDRLKLVKRFCDRNAALLEIGAGDCEFSLAACREVGRVVAVDVSAEILNFDATHQNLEVYLTDGTTFPLEDGSIDVVFSDQLIEHLHPEDVATQMREVRRVLSPKGVYVCITPNRANGPHDISGYFDDNARGLHLREYNSTKLREVFALPVLTSFVSMLEVVVITSESLECCLLRRSNSIPGSLKPPADDCGHGSLSMPGWD